MLARIDGPPVHRCALLCAFTFVWCGGAAPLLAQGDPILAKLSADATNVLVVRDVMKPIEQLLAAPATKELLAATADVQKEMFGRAFSPEVLRAQIGLFAPLVPAEIVIAAPTSTADKVTHALAFAVDAFGLSVLSRANDPDEETVEKLRDAAAEHLQQLDALPLQAWVRTRDKRTAEQWFEVVGEWAGTQGKALGIETKAEGDRLQLRWEPFAAGGALRQALERAKVPLDGAPKGAIEATLELAEDRLSLQIGKLAPPPCAADRFGAMWAGEPLLFGRVKLDDAVDVTDGYLHLVEVGVEDLQPGDQAIVEQLQAQLLQLASLSNDTTVAVGTDADGAWTQLEYAFAEPPGDDLDFVPAGLQRFVDVQAPFWLTSNSLDVVLASSWDEVETRAQSRGKPAVGAELFAAAIEFLNGDESAVFAPGVAIVAREAAFRGAKDWKHGPMPFAAEAIVVLPATAEEGEQFVRELTRLVAEGIGVEAPKWEAADLGLGVPTHALRLDTLPGYARLGLDWDFRPHWFFVDATMVVSTDPQLSKELQRRAAKEPAAKPPDGRLCEWLHFPGQAMVDAFAGLARWIPVLDELDFGTADGIRTLGAASKLLAAASQHVERFERTSTLHGKVLRSRSVLRLRAAK